MGKKKIKLISGIVAAALTCSVAFGGCSLISTDTAKDMKRTIAEVDISKTEAFKTEFGDNRQDRGYKKRAYNILCKRRLFLHAAIRLDGRTDLYSACGRTCGERCAYAVRHNVSFAAEGGGGPVRFGKIPLAQR